MTTTDIHQAILVVYDEQARALSEIQDETGQGWHYYLGRIAGLSFALGVLEAIECKPQSEEER